MSLNEELFNRAKKSIPGGVNSPVRAFNAVGGIPRFVKRANGPYFWDANSKKYIDYIGSWGPAIVGHANPEVIEAVQKSAHNGLSFGAPTELEILMAEEICKLVPSIEQLRLVSSGTEAVMSALRLSRGYTKRDIMIKFEGCYHGHVDAMLVKAGSGLSTFGKPSSSGVPKNFSSHTIVLEYNNSEFLEKTFKEIGSSIACVILEPIAGNMNFIRGKDEFLKTARDLCTKYGSTLIFDEVMTGFRVAKGGVQSIQNIIPDITVLGKVIGGGLPVAAFGSRKEIMSCLSPEGPIYQAGTLSGNPVAVTAGLTTLKILQKPNFFENLSKNSNKLVRGIVEIAKEKNIKMCGDSLGGMFGIFFLESLPTNYSQIIKFNNANFNKFFHLMLDEGVYFAPSAFEAGFISSDHNEIIIDETLKKVKNVLEKMSKENLSTNLT